MQSVTALSADVRHAARVATAFSGASALLFAATIAAGAYATEHVAPTLDVYGWSILAGSATAALTAAYMLLAARDRILLRTGLWFGHAYAHHHLTRGALEGVPLDTLADEERSLRTVHTALLNGTIARRMDAICLPLVWLALTSIHPMYAIATASVAGILIGAGRVLCGRPDQDAAHVALGEIAQSDNPRAGDIDAWEIQNRAVIAYAYADGKRNTVRHIVLGILAIVAAAAFILGTAYLLQLGSITLLGAAAAALLQLRHASVALSYAADATARGRTRHAANALRSARLTALEGPQYTTHQPSAPRYVAPGPTLVVRHAA
jgi:hypothetical protein